MSIRLVLADDDALVRAGLRTIIETQTDLQVIGEAADGHEAIRVTLEHRPDLVLMDVQMPGMDGIAATSRILEQDPGIRVVVLTTFEVDEYVYGALRVGASGFLLKRARPEELHHAIRATAAGDAWLSASITRRLLDRFAVQATTEAPDLELLTDREREVLSYLARGLSNAEIAADLFVSEETVKTHVSRVLMKLHLRDRTQAVVYAYEHGIVVPGG